VGDDFMHSLRTAVDSFIVSLAEVTLGSDVADAPPLPSPTPYRNAAAPDRHRVGLGAIRDSDPAFELDAFLVHVGQMFSAYHEARDNGDLKPARRFIDENAWAELAEAAKKDGRRADGPRTLKIRAIRPETAVHEDGLDLVRVFITAEQSGSDELLCEYWELIRKRGTLTKSGLDLIHCPNCGAPIDGDDPTRCAYCGERLADPALDWVVRKIMEQ
jgi:hypothetical protein